MQSIPRGGSCWGSILIVTFWGLLTLSTYAASPAVRVLFGLNKPPYIIEGERRGLEYELVSLIMSEMGYRVEPEFVPPARLVSLVRVGQFDAASTLRAISGLPGYYSAPYIRYQNVAITLEKRGITLHAISDLSRYSVVGFQNARLHLGPTFRNMADNNSRYREVSPQWLQNNLLFTGHIDVVIVDRKIFRHFNKEVKDRVDTQQAFKEFALFPPTDYQMMFRDSRLRDQFNKALMQVKQDGRYDSITKRYGILTEIEN